MSSPIQLIVGLGNPGDEYTETRHNAGAWFVETIAKRVNVELRFEKKFHGLVATFEHENHVCRLLFPMTFMNKIGLSIRKYADFYAIPPQAILVAHDDLDLAPGVARIKFGGGHGGHNGLRDTIKHLNTNDFYRLRLGIGHPGDRSQVLDYVLHTPSRSDKKLIDTAIEDAFATLPLLLKGDIPRAMQQLHTDKNKNV